MAPNATDSTDSSGLPLAKDLSSLFVPSMRKHAKSPFKAVMGNPTMAMINMAGGVPNPSMFPLMQVQARVRAPSGYSDGQDGVLVLDKTQHSSSAESLDELLQYNDGRGMGSYCRFLRKHTQLVHRPQYADWDVIASCGSTDAIGKVFSLFCEAGDTILVEQWSFPGALSNLATTGVKAIGVAMDSEGMQPEALDSICTNWTGSRPLRAMYIVPTGQNPTGATMSLARRTAIYAIAQKHNLAIIEDDPYYFLQLEPAAAEHGSADERPQLGKQELVPSLLSLDVDGRVVRLDSFSKILAPNLRCGWITAAGYLLDRLQILNESSILQPSGLTQGVLAKMLSETWGLEGWNAHLRDLRVAYTQRRNHFVQLARKHLCGLAEFAVPAAGMFVWMKIDLGAAAADPSAMPRLMDSMKKCGVMMAPSMPFSSAGTAGTAESAHYLRAAYALVDSDMFEPALVRLAQAITAIRSGGAPEADSGAIGKSRNLESTELSAAAPVAANASG